MADSKISALPAATTPLAGTEVLPIVQSGATDQVTVANLTAGRAVATAALSATGIVLTTDATDASSTTAAALKTAGGLAVVKKIYVGDNIVPAVAAKGINFTANTPAAGMTSQLLNWYEEGTWTPLLSDGTNNATTDANTGGTYTRVGRMLHLTLYISTTSLGSVSGGLSVKGFPFACRNSQSSRASTVSGYSANILVTAGQSVGLLMSNNATTATVTLIGGATGSAVMTSTQWTATGQAFFQISYPI